MNDKYSLTMLLEKWVRWTPINNLSRSCYIESFVDSSDGFKIYIINEANENIVINFAHSVISYKVTDETCAIDRLDIFKGQSEIQFYVDWVFFKIINSLYIQELIENSDIKQSFDLIHFMIFDDDFIVDIIATSEPILEIV